jgi:uncharacterized protein (DUF433 family)
MGTQAELLNRITVNSSVMVGKPTVRGTRLTVEHVLKALARQLSFEDLRDEYPFLEKEDVSACLLYAAQQIEGEKIYPIAA